MPDEKKRKRREPREYSSVIREHKKDNSIFSNFMVQPDGISVEVQDENEQILLVVRRHPITNLPWIAFAVILFLIPLVFMTQPFWLAIPVAFRFMATVFWGLLILTIVLEGFLNWYFDVFVITDERVIDIDFKNLIYKNITTTKIDNIEDVTYSVSGPLASLLNYGNVLIQTAGAVVKMEPSDTVPAIEMWSTPNPAKVAKLINELILEEEQEKLEGRAR